jgi:hypothetical protein
MDKNTVEEISAQSPWKIKEATDERLAFAGRLISDGTMNRIRDIVQLVKITSLSKVMHINYNTMVKRLYAPKAFTVEEIGRLAKLLSIEKSTLYQYLDKEVSGR